MSLRILNAIWRFVSATPSLMSVALLPIAAWLTSYAWRFPTATQRAGRWAAATTLVLGALDWALLTALPHLGLSFGPVGLPLLGITGVRLLLSVSLARVWQWVGNHQQGAASAQGLVAGLTLLWALNLGVLACEIDSLYVEPFHLRVTELHLPSLTLLPDRPLRIVQLADLHVERTTKREWELLKLVNVLEPDIIVLTGDYLNMSYVDDPVARRDARELLAQLHASHGVYAVTARGVDPPDAVAGIFDGLDITVLRDEVRCLKFDQGDLCLVGVSYLDRKRDMASLFSLMEQVPEDAYSLLLYHTPDIIEVAAEEGVDLYLAGHTHGGQIRLPLFGAVITASVYGKKYERGHYTVGETTLYVSGGIGMEGRGAPRARFLCPPEIVVVDLGPDV